MSSNTFHLVIASVADTLFDGAATSLHVPTTAGEITVLAHHEPFITTLKEGVMTIQASGETKTFSITSGVVEIANNKVVVLL